MKTRKRRSPQLRLQLQEHVGMNSRNALAWVAFRLERRIRLEREEAQREAETITLSSGKQIRPIK